MVVSLWIQSILLAAILVLPLLSTERLALHRWVSIPVPPVLPHGLEQHHETGRVPATRLTTTVPDDYEKVRAPARIPNLTEALPVQDLPDARSLLGVPGGDPNGRPDGVLKGILSANPSSVLPSTPAYAPRRLVISHYDPGMLLWRVTPVYPRAALLTRTEGAVVLRAVVAKDGSVREVRVISGTPLLVGAAVDAVRQWQFKPYLLNNEPIEVETQVTVNFVLNR